MGLTTWLRDLAAGYGREDAPLGAYAGLTALFSAASAACVVAAGTAGHRSPERVAARDIVLLGVATHKLSRLLTKDHVTTPLRAPFTEFQGPAGAGEVNERPRGVGLQHVLGELVTCPFCLGQWVAAALGCGLALAPARTRLVASVYVALTISDFLHFAYAATRSKTEQLETKGQAEPGSG